MTFPRPTTLTVAVFGGLLCGLACGIVAAGVAGLPDGTDASLVIAACTVGMMVATPLFGFFADAIGRKAAIRIGALTLVLSSLLVGTGGRLPSLLFAGRFLQGAGIGCLFAVLPTYVSETAPAGRAGRILALFQFGVLLGQVAGALAGLLLTRSFGLQTWLWRVCFVLPAVPSVLFVILTGGLRESSAGVRVRNRKPLDGLVLAFRSPDNRRPFLLAMLMCALVAATANGPIMNFCVKAMRDAGLSGARANVVDVVMQFLCLVATLAASVLVDRVGSRCLMVVGSFGTAVGLAGMAIFLPMQAGCLGAVSLLVFAVLFCFGPGICVFVVLTELLPERIRAVGIAVSLFANHAVSALAACLFTRMVETSGYGLACGFFAAVAVLLTVFAAVCLPRRRLT